MSLLDDVSIVVTPNGYKAGTLYGVLPTAVEGSEEVTNGNFATDSDWTKGTGWTISGGKASNDGTSGSNNLTQSGILVVGKQYKIDITVSNYVSGSVEVSAGADPRSSMSANGTYTFYQTCTPTTNFYIIAQTFNGSVDNVSVKEWTASDMDVTRATAATRVDENGLVNYAEVIGDEEVTDGNFPSGTTAWSFGGGWSLGVGVAEADGSTSTSNLLTQDLGLVATKTYTISFSSNRVGGTLFVKNGTSYSSSTIYTLNTGTGLEVQTFTVTSPSNSEIGFYAYNYEGTIDDVTVKQVDRDNVPRIDYTGGGCPHILAEPQRTNLLTYSEDFSTYTPVGGIVVEGNQTDPNGNNTAYKLSNFSANNSRLDGNTSSTAVNGVTYTYSAYYKGSGTIRINCGTSTGVGGSSEKDIILTNEWTRQQVTFTASSPTGVVKTHAAITRTPNNDAIVYLAFAQIEEGSYPTSYIPTSGSTVTRNKDVFTRDGIASLINDSEGVLFIEMARQNGDTAAGIISLNNGAGTQNVALYYFSTGQIAFDVISSSPVVTGSSASHNTYNFNKIAIKYKSGDIALWVNGVEVVTKTNTISLSGLNKISFGYGNDTFPFFGKIKQLQVFKTALTDAQLTSLTT